MGIFDWLRFGRRGGAHQRWVVVDVETSGMDVSSDQLIAIGAVAIVDGRVVPGDSLEIIVKQAAASSRENILVHGVGAHAQLNGTDPPHAVRAFMDYAGRAPMLAFHAPFDRSFLARVTKHYVNQPFDNPWLDIAELAPALSPKLSLKSLDEWLQHYGIPVAARHSAASDAFATALLMTRLLPEARRQGAPGFGDMQKLARAAKWLQ
ncbi:MAG TPA: 3'-5' exonuclease [Burkholderiaceae bacterium]|nr:3'-5' exonuclease [Burkholderiaceae bacterium]HQR71012.1 3'-5' exonuclease [Burkholderiaceae bacterium]